MFVNSCLAAMVELDGDDIRISSRGRLAERDIVQVTALLQSDGKLCSIQRSYQRQHQGTRPRLHRNVQLREGL